MGDPAWSAQQQAALRRVAMMVAGTTSPEEVFATVAAEVGQVLGADFTSMVRYESRTSAAVVAAWATAGRDVTIPVGTRLPVSGANVHTLVFQTGKPARLDTVTEDVGPALAPSVAAGIRSAVGVPISAEGRLWGAVIVSTTRAEPLTPGTETRLAGFTELVAAAVANAQARLELSTLAAEQAALRRVATLVARGEPPAAVFATVAEETGRVLAADLVSIGRYDPDDTVTMVATWSAAGDAIPVGLSAPVGRSGLPQLVRATGRPSRIDRYSPAMRTITYKMGVRAAVAAPITVEGRPWGMVAVATKSEDTPLPPGTEDRLAAFTELVATAIANAQTREDLREVAAEQAALRRVATLVARAAPPEEVFAAVTSEVGQLLDAEVAATTRYNPDGTGTVAGIWTRTGATWPVSVGTRADVGGQDVLTLVFQTRRPARIDRYREDATPLVAAALAAGMLSTVGVPIIVEDRLWGIIAVTSTREDPLPAETEARLTGFTGLVATAIANAQAREELRSVADEQAALRRVATLVARGASPGELFQAVCEEARSVLSADATAIVRGDPDGEATIVALAGDHVGGLQVGSRRRLDPQLAIASALRTGRSARADDYSGVEDHLAELVREMRTRSSVASPIVVEDRIWGAIGAGTAREPFPPDTEQRMVNFTELVATAIANADAQAELTASRVRVVATADETRRRIERHLHDGAQQRLVSLTLRLRSAQAAVPSELDGLSAQLDRVVAGLTRAQEELREFAHGVHPAVLTEAGLAPAFKTLARRSPVPVQLDVRTTARLPEHVEVTAYYVVSEALANAAKHASASAITVDVEAIGGVLSVSVRDNGGGGADLSGGTGLIGLKDRVEAIGGKLTLRSSPGRGTSLVVELPAG
jgi:GAF domain-containing protein